MAGQRWSAALVFGLLLLLPLASAWPGWLPDLDSLIVRRDDSTSSTKPPSSTPTSAPSSAPTSAPTNTGTNTGTNSGTATSGGFADIQTNLNTGGRTGSGTATASGNNTQQTHTEYNPQDPAGSVVMVTPAATLGPQLYKIGSTVTWAWNYTNLQGTPTAVDVLVSCSTASNTWTLTQNMTFATDGAFTWDTNAYAQTAVASPLLTEQYTLVIYDADGAITDTADAGYLAPFDGFVFGMYTPQPYTPLADWQCATCSAAVSEMDRKALGFALTMSVITVLSFTWFVTGIGGIM